MKSILLEIIFTFSLFCIAQIGVGQCQNDFQFPNVTLSAPTDYDTLLIGNPSYLGDFAEIEGFEQNKTYVITSDSVNDYITLRSFDNAEVIAHGSQPLTYTASNNIDLTVHFNDSACGNENVPRVTHCIHLPSPLDTVRRVGINHESPITTLDINGKLRLSDDAVEPQAGMIRYYAPLNDFQGFDGDEWVSLSPSHTKYGKSPIIENVDDAHFFVNLNSQMISANGHFGEDIAIVDNFCFVTSPGDFLISNILGEVRVFEYSEDEHELNNHSYLTNLVDFQELGLISFGIGGIDAKNDKLIVGCPNIHGVDNYESGKALVFKKSGNEMEIQQVLHNPTESFNQTFGTQVAIGENLALVEKYTQAAIVIDVFKSINNTWTYITSIDQEDIDTDNANSLSIDGDLLVIGYPSYNSNFGGSGIVKVYHFNHDDNTVDLVASLSDQRFAGKFGSNVLLKDNVLAISDVPNFSISISSLFFLYYVSEDTTYLMQQIEEVNANDFTFFGTAAEIIGNTLLVAEPSILLGGGRTYIYKYLDDKWVLKDQIKQYTLQSQVSSSFAESIAFHPKFIIVGSPRDNYGNIDQAGRISVYYRQ